MSDLQQSQMTVEQAIQLAKEDVARIRDAVEFGCLPGECVVDGSMFSPSWRALDGGAEVWAALDYAYSPNTTGINHPAIERAIDAEEAYLETLDAGTDELGLYWEDGCLWVPAEDDDDE